MKLSSEERFIKKKLEFKLQTYIVLLILVEVSIVMLTGEDVK